MNLAFKRWHMTLCEQALNNVALYGAGDLGKQAFNYLKDTHVDIACFIDRSAEKCEYTFMDLPVYPPSSVSGLQVDAVLICSESFSAEIESALFDLLVNVEKGPRIMTMKTADNEITKHSVLFVDSPYYWENQLNSLKTPNALYERCVRLLSEK